MALQKQTYNHHQPVLLEQVVTILAPEAGESYLDLTAGYGGHAAGVLDRTKTPEKMTLVDRDETAITALKSFSDKGARVIRSDFASFLETITSPAYDLILLDLGVSSAHFDTSERGFSFRLSGPLDMRMDRRQSLSADTIVNTWRPERLADVIRRYGEEPHAVRIARAIDLSRPLRSTGELAEVVRRAVPVKGYQRIHPATRTFQALRIAVNDELVQLERALKLIPNILNPGGRWAVISFHSLEDRIVKQTFNDIADPRDYEAAFVTLTKRPIRGIHHDVHNPRARSAILRAVVKINNQRKERINAN